MERRYDHRQDISPEVVRQVHILHDQKPWNDPGIKVHRGDHQPVPQLSVPHLLLGKHESQKCRSAHGSECSQKRSHQRDLRRLKQAVDSKRAAVVLQMNPFGPEQDHTSGTQIIGADRIDKHIIKRIQTKNRADTKNYVAYNTDHLISKTLMSSFLDSNLLTHGILLLLP